MAIATSWVVSQTAVTTTALIYTVPSSTSATYGYARDLIINNGGPSTCFFGLGTGVTGGVTTSSFQVPAGGSVILTQCQVPSSGIIGAVSSGTSSVSIGYGTNVSYV